MIALASEIEEVETPKSANPFMKGPKCAAPTCFIGSYAPITPAGKTGPFNVNTYYLQADRKKELVGAVPVRSS